MGANSERSTSMSTRFTKIAHKNGFCHRFNGRQTITTKITVRTPQPSNTPLLSILTQKLV
jgi:hypothetical protein